MKPDANMIRQLFPEIEIIENKELAEKIIAVWIKAYSQAKAGARLADIPFFNKIPKISLVQHIRKVILVAKALINVIETDPDAPPVDKDVLFAACFLHDVDKVLLQEPTSDGLGWQPSKVSRWYPHGYLGAMLCSEAGLPEVVVHLVATHSNDAPIPPEPYEGILLHYADYFAADTAFWRAGLPPLFRH